MSGNHKAAMSDEERTKLAEKLDKDVEDFIGTRERRPYRDGFNLENLDSEMQNHPAFRTEPIGADEELSPLVEAMQQLKYDPNENTPDELARHYKDDGNHNFKIKKYRWAILAYTEGIKIGCGDQEICAQLFTNRAAAHFHLGNFRSSFGDCESALRHKPDHLKAINRAVQCGQKLGRHVDVVSFCDKGLEISPKDAFFLEQKSAAQKMMKIEERDRRKSIALEKKERQWIAKLTVLIKLRGIRMVGGLDGGGGGGADTRIVEGADSPVTAMVHFNEDGSLSWPVTFHYPEYGQTDMIPSFDENSRIEDRLQEIFSERPPWDIESKYVPDRLQVYFEASPTVLCAVSQDAALGWVLQNPRISVYHGMVHFYVTVKSSAFDNHFVKQYEKVIQVGGQ